ncbi:MAG: PQQ-like beta-propeller repeat protein [Phycisphaerae bacterium]|jgi:outer membrane protein assembly factor BamB
MKSKNRHGFVKSAVLCLTGSGLVAACGCSMHQAEWPQWGGPGRDFIVESEGLADEWPDDGPPKLWHRELGDGYSTIAVDGDRLYTMYRTGDDEFTVALDATTGETIWAHKHPSPPTQTMQQFGPGPHSTPLIVANRLYTVGTNAMMHCFDKTTGKVLWEHDLVKEFGAPVPTYGYGCSPLAYKDTVILPVDRKREQPSGEGGEEEEAEAEVKPEEQVEGQALIAFDQRTGEVVWKNQDIEISYSSPILTDWDGRDELVLLASKEIFAVDPDNGELRWQHVTEPEGANISTPVWNDKNLIFCTSAYDSGSRALKLTKDGEKTAAEQVWYSRKMRVHHGNVVRLGDHIYGSSGDFGPAFFMGINLNTGKVAWRERGFKKATCVYGDGKLIILDEDGNLALATVTPEGMTVHSKCKVTERLSWAAPTLVGKTLYVRDRKHIMALDLS